MKFIVDKELFKDYPELQVGIIVCNGIDNTKSIDLTKEMDVIKENIRNKFEGVELAQYPIIRKWRDIYKSFGEKKARSSIEALIRRTLNGNDIPNINSLVDIYNMISIKYELPCGGEDLDHISSDVKLTYAKGIEEFISLGTDKIETVNEGEIVYKFDNTVICRNFNYRESDITKLTKETKNAVLVIESVLEDSKLDEALEELANLVENKLDAKTRICKLTVNNNEVDM